MLKKKNTKISKKRILPISSVNVRGFSHQASLLSILMAYEECMPWICNNFIQIFTLHNLCDCGIRSGTLDFFYMEYNDFKSYEYTANPWIRWFEIPLNILAHKTDIIDYIIRNIDLNYYSYLEIDKYYISKYGEYKNRHRAHWLYICGYDLDEAVIFCLDNFSGEKFRLEKVSIEEIRNGYIERYNYYLNRSEMDNEDWPGIGLFKIILTAEEKNNSDLHEVNLERIICLLRNYLGEEEEILSYTKSKYYVYGIKAYYELIAFTEKEWKNEQKIDLRAFYSMKDHKALMAWRIEYIENYFNIGLNEFKKQYLFLEKKLYTVVLLIIKFNITYKRKILYKIKFILKECIEEEKNIISELIKALERINIISDI